MLEHAEQLNVKLFVSAETTLTPLDAIPIFHRWIQEDRITTDLLIDVADYTHIPDGPGMMLICDRAHYALDENGGRLGFLYRVRRGIEGAPLAQRLAETIRRTALAAAMLEDEAPGANRHFSIDGQEFSVFIQDRLRAPNDEATFHELEQALREALAPLNTDVTFEWNNTPGEVLGVKVRLGSSIPAARLQQELAAAS